MKSCLHYFSTGKLTGLILSILEFSRGGNFSKETVALHGWECNRVISIINLVDKLN